jgi:nucleoside-diphosphate-sugar epimerase
MNIAITGGSGFIGQRLKALLEQGGHSVTIIDLRHSAPVDVLDLPALTKALEGCEAIYHLAAEHADNVTPRSRYYDVNVIGTGNVTKAADANGIKRVIFTSSFAVYGLDARTPDETSKPAPFNDYGQSKLEGEQVLQDWQASTPSANLTIVRPVVVFGEGNRGNVYNLIHQIASGRFMMVGDGRNRKSMAYVGNVAAFLNSLLTEHKPGEIYNYADTPDYSMNELVSSVRDNLGQTRPVFALPYTIGIGAGMAFDGLSKITGRKFPISVVRIQKFCADTTCDAQKARRHGFIPPFTLDEGLARMIAYDFAAQAKSAA